jgi:hypothetical protein
MTFATACDQLAATGAQATPIIVLAVAFVAVGVALLVARRWRSSVTLAIALLVAVGTLTIAPVESSTAIAATSCSTHHSGGSGNDSFTPSVDGDGVCQWVVDATDPVISLNNDPSLWIKYDYTSVLREIQPSDCTLELDYYEDHNGDTVHDINDPSSWDTNADIAGLVGDPTYNPAPGIIIWTPSSTTNFIRLIVRDTATGDIVASYDSNVFDATPPNNG